MNNSAEWAKNFETIQDDKNFPSNNIFGNLIIGSFQKTDTEKYIEAVYKNCLKLQKQDEKNAR